MKESNESKRSLEAVVISFEKGGNTFVVSIFYLGTCIYTSRSYVVAPISNSEKRDWCMSNLPRPEKFECPTARPYNSLEIAKDIHNLTHSAEYFFVNNNFTRECLIREFKVPREYILFIKDKIAPLSRFFCLPCYLSPYSSHECALNSVLAIGNYLKNTNTENFPSDMILPDKSEYIKIPIDMVGPKKHDLKFHYTDSDDNDGDGISEASELYEKSVLWNN